MPFNYKYKPVQSIIAMDPRKLQAMIAVTLLLYGLRLFLPVMVSFLGSGAARWFSMVFFNMFSAAVFVFTLVTVILLILDAKKG